jgi:predicted dinucleotide-binding enzyme
MNTSIIGTGEVGLTLASFFAKAGIEVALANTKGRLCAVSDRLTFSQLI